jgi:alpha-2-macroglobulin-like protein
LSNDKVKQGETTRLSTILTNRTKEVITSPIAIVGIPSGLSPQPWQLKALQEEQTIAYYEVMHNKVVFYLREMAAGEVKNIHLDLKAEIPGKYQGPASNAYLYYENDVMAWVPPTWVEVKK